MSKSKSFFGIGGFTIFFSALGYFVYGGLQGALAVFILTFSLGILAIAGLIPVVGNIIYWNVAKGMLMPKIFVLTGM